MFGLFNEIDRKYISSVSRSKENFSEYRNNYIPSGVSATDMLTDLGNSLKVHRSLLKSIVGVRKIKKLKILADARAVARVIGGLRFA